MFRLLQFIAWLAGAVGVGVAVAGGVGLNHFQEGEGGVGELGLTAIDEAELAFDLKLTHADADEGTAGELILHREPRNEGDAIAHFHEAFDGLKRGKLNIHVEWRAMFTEGLNHLLALWRRDIVGDEVECAELADRDLTSLRQRVLWAGDERELIAVDDDGLDLCIFGAKGDDADLDGVHEELILNPAGERALYGDLDAWVLTAVLIEQRQ